MARLVLWKVLNTTARDALVVAEPEVGNYALVYADGLLYKAMKGGTGSGVWESEEVLDVTSLVASGAVAAGTTLTAGTNTVTPKVNSAPANTANLALTDAASIATNAADNTAFTVTIADNRTLANPTGLVRGTWYTWLITQDGSGGHTLAYGNLFRFAGGAPTVTAGAGLKSRIIGFYDGVTLDCISLLDVKA
jgi:hypothetical protein